MIRAFLLFFSISCFGDLINDNVETFQLFDNANKNQFILFKETVNDVTTTKYTYFNGTSYSTPATLNKFTLPSYGAMDPSGNVLFLKYIEDEAEVLLGFSFYYYNKTTDQFSDEVIYSLTSSIALESVQSIQLKSVKENNFQIVALVSYPNKIYKGTILDQNNIFYLNVDVSNDTPTFSNGQLINKKNAWINQISFQLDPSSNILISYTEEVAVSAFAQASIQLAYKSFKDTTFSLTSYPLSFSNDLIYKGLSKFSKVNILKGVNSQRTGRYDYLSDLYVNYNTLSSYPWSVNFFYNPSKNYKNISFYQTNFSKGFAKTLLNQRANILASSQNGNSLFFNFEKNSKNSTTSNYALYNLNQSSSSMQNFNQFLDTVSTSVSNNSFFSATRSIDDYYKLRLNPYPLTILLNKEGSSSQTLGVVYPYNSVEKDTSDPALSAISDTSTYVIYVNKDLQLVSEVYGN